MVEWIPGKSPYLSMLIEKKFLILTFAFQKTSASRSADNASTSSSPSPRASSPPSSTSSDGGPGRRYGPREAGSDAQSAGAGSKTDPEICSQVYYCRVVSRL